MKKIVFILILLLVPIIIPNQLFFNKKYEDINVSLLHKINKVFVFGDSHIKGILGKFLQNDINIINPDVKFQYTAINGANFTNNFMFKKDSLIKQIKMFNPDLIICFLGENEIFYNEKDYKNIIRSADKFFDKNFKNYNIAIVSTIYNPLPSRYNVNTGLYEFCKNRKFKFINIYDSKYSIINYRTDKYHYNVQGYKILSKYIIDLI